MPQVPAEVEAVAGAGAGVAGGPQFPSGDVFVSAATGNDTNAGTQQAPVATIARGLAIADSGATVRIAGGSYREVVSPRSNVDLMGGYEPASWARDTAGHPTTVVNTHSAVAAVGVHDVVLDGLRLVADSASGFAVVTLDSSTGIVIRGSTISAPSGFDAPAAPAFIPARADGGGDGAQGTATDYCPPAITGGPGGSGGPGGNGGAGGTGGAASGFAGSGGAGSGAGGGGAGGAPAGDGAAGKPASHAGSAGPDGAGGTGFGAYLMKIGYFGPTAGIGTQGQAGPGGGGGGGGGGPVFAPICGGGGGGGGEGGAAGSGGNGGWSGGPSIGVVVSAGSELVLDASVVITAGGGQGGVGGVGQAGGPGGRGGYGGVGASLNGRGGNGGAGGNGGDGGWGGGGVGGPSIGVLVLGGGSFTPTNVSYQIGAGGAGGAGRTAATDGATGDSASVKAMPS